MYNNVTAQNLITCVCAIIIEAFALTKKPQKHSNLKTYKVWSNFDHWTVASYSLICIVKSRECAFKLLTSFMHSF